MRNTHKMKITLSILFMLTTVISTFSTAIAATVKPATVTLQSVTLLSNDHVGNQWAYEIKVNGQKMSINKGIKISGSKITTVAKVVENDKVPDIGTKTVNLTNGKVNTFDVTVVENRGRYSGKKAVWRIKLKVN